MRSKWMWLMAVMMLVMLGCLTMRSVEKRSQSELVERVRAGENCVAERLGRSEDVVERIGWRAGIGEWGSRGRPYRNPLRRYRVSKKVRMQLRRRLAGMAEKSERLASFCKKAEDEWSMESARVAEANVESGRWG